MSTLPNFDVFLAPHKTAPKQATPQQADDNWRELEIYLKSRKAGSSVTAGQFDVGANPSGIGGPSQWMPLGLAGDNVWLITDAEGDTEVDFGYGWAVNAGANTAVVSLPGINVPTFSGVSSITLTLLEIGAVSADGNDAARWLYTGPSALTSGGSLFTTVADFTPTSPTIGTSLSLQSSSPAGIRTSRSAVFLAGVSGKVDYTGAVFDV